MIRITKPFNDKKNNMIKRNLGELLDFGKERNSELIKKGFAVSTVKPKNEAKPKVNKEIKETKEDKTPKKTK